MTCVSMLAACDKQSATPTPSANSESDARPQPVFKESKADQKVSMTDLMASASQQQGSQALPPGHPPLTSMPAGHPPMGSRPAGTMAPGATLPAGHPAVGGAGMAGMGVMQDEAPEKLLSMKQPAGWVSRPPRRMTVAVYTVPKAPGDSEDAEVTVSHYPGMKDVPLDLQVQRWAGQFEQPDSRPSSEVLKQTRLPNAAHPVTVIDISGRYRAGSMMGGQSSLKDNYRMLMSVIETDEGPWFVRLLGPKATVAAHEAEYLEFVRTAG
jgi:hypothetical protein